MVNGETMQGQTEEIQFESYPVPLERVTAYTREHSRPASVKGHYATRIFIRILLAFGQSLSWKWAYRVGSGIGKLMYWFKIRRGTAMINLDIVYGEQKTPEEKEPRTCQNSSARSRRGGLPDGSRTCPA